MTILDELKKTVSEYQCDFKKFGMAGVIVSHKTFQDIRTQHPLGFVETSDGDAYLYGLLVIKDPLCPDDKAYVINQELVNNYIWHQLIVRGNSDDNH